jgi:hypothetical protein
LWLYGFDSAELVYLVVIEPCKFGNDLQVSYSSLCVGLLQTQEGSRSSQISRQSAHEGGKVFNSKNRPPLPQEIFIVLISNRGRVDSRTIMWPEGLSMKNSSVTFHTRGRNSKLSQWLPGLSGAQVLSAMDRFWHLRN